MSRSSKIVEAEDRLRMLSDSIEIQEGLLEEGSTKLIQLDAQYNALDREYKMLLRDKASLAREVEALAENLDLFSDD